MWRRQQEIRLLYLQNPVIGSYVRPLQANPPCYYNSCVGLRNWVPCFLQFTGKICSHLLSPPLKLRTCIPHSSTYPPTHATYECSALFNLSPHSRYVRVSRTLQPIPPLTLRTCIPHTSTYLPRSRYVRVFRTPQRISPTHATYEYSALFNLSPHSRYVRVFRTLQPIPPLTLRTSIPHTSTYPPAHATYEYPEHLNLSPRSRYVRVSRTLQPIPPLTLRTCIPHSSTYPPAHATYEYPALFNLSPRSRYVRVFRTPQPPCTVLHLITLSVIHTIHDVSGGKSVFGR
jgi:hypothetical protein